MKRRSILVSTFAGACLLVGCKDTGKQAPSGATGICFSHLSTTRNDEVISVHQAIIVHGSGDPVADISRFRAFSEDRFASHNPHTVPNLWLGAWLYDERSDLTSGPDCSALPMIEVPPSKPQRQ